MATFEWAQERGRELIKSEVVELDESSAAELFALGIVGTSIGAFVGLIVGIERHGSPVIASVVIDDFAVEIDARVGGANAAQFGPLLEPRNRASEVGIGSNGNGDQGGGV